MDSRSLTVANKVVQITDQTRIVAENGAQLAVGAWVQVVAHQQDASALVADMIYIPEQQITQTPVDMHGLLQEVHDNYFVMDGMSIVIDPQTVIAGALEVGRTAYVQAIPVVVTGAVPSQATQWLALSVRVKDSAVDLAQTTFTGIIEALPGTSALSVGDDVQTWVVSGVTVLVGSATQFSGESAAVGQAATVTGMRLADSSIQASMILVQDPAAVMDNFSGTITAIGDNAWTIGGQQVLVTAQTVIDESEAAAQVGMDAAVTALRQADGQLVAQYIQLQRP